MRFAGKTILCKSIFLLWALLISCEDASAQTMDDFVQQASEHALWVDGEIRDRVAEVASNEFHNLLNHTEFIVDRDTAIPTAYAESLSSGRKRIIISAQLVLVFYYTAEVNHLHLFNNNKWEKCALAYASYLRISYGQIMEDSLAGRKPLLLQPPEDYARENSGQCAGLERHYPFPKSLKERRWNSVSAAIATVYLHEVAHHVYRDTIELTERLDLTNPQNMRLYLRSMCHSQQKELRADKWAARALADLGWGSDIFDMTFWGALTSLGDIDPDFERGTTHPSPSRRMGIFLDTGRTYLRAMGVELRQDLSDLIDEAIRLQQKIELLLPVMPIAGSGGCRLPLTLIKAVTMVRKFVADCEAIMWRTHLKPTHPLTPPRHKTPALASHRRKAEPNRAKVALKHPINRHSFVAQTQAPP